MSQNHFCGKADLVLLHLAPRHQNGDHSRNHEGQGVKMSVCQLLYVPTLSSGTDQPMLEHTGRGLPLVIRKGNIPAQLGKAR